jgi:ribosomal protein S18 acetylase RimI-like enzyme
MIKLLNINNLNEVMIIIKNVIADMNEKGINQWDDVYPNMEIITNDIESNTAFGYFDENMLVGYIALNENYSPEYDLLNWKSSGNPLIIHRLSVAPQNQGKGIAKKCIRFAEEYAKKYNFKSIRLDAFSDNPGALRLYENLNYEKAGTITFRKGIFVCFEKLIS